MAVPDERISLLVIISALLALLSSDASVTRACAAITSVVVDELPVTRNRRFWVLPRNSTWAEEPKWPEDYFIKKTRLTRKMFDDLAQHMPEHKDTRFRKAVSKRERLGAAMCYLAKGTPFDVIGDSFGIGESTVRDAVNEAITVINKSVPFPSFGKEEIHGIVADFEVMGGFPGTAGCVDGTFIPVRTSVADQGRYWCYKGFTSIILLGVCRPNLEFTFVHVGSPGRIGDAAAFHESGLGKFLEDTLEPQFHLLGDSAFPLTTWLQRPYAITADMDYESRYFNYRLSATRMLIERAFGLLKKRFRCLRYQLDFNDIAFSVQVIAACVRLHNWCLNHKELDIPYEGATNMREQGKSEGPVTSISEKRKRKRSDLKAGEEKRAKITRTLYLQRNVQPTASSDGN